MQYEEAFEAAGMMGKGQYLIIFVSYLLTLYGGWQSVLPVFVALKVPFKCANHHNQTDNLVWNYDQDDLFDSKCVDGCEQYIYEDNPASLISEFDLACGGNKILASLSNSIYWIGFLVACFVIGYAGDRFGRRPVNLIVVFLFFIFSTASFFSFDIWFYIAMRLFCGFCHGGLTAMSFLLMAEAVDKKYLAELSMGSNCVGAFGEMLAPAFAYTFQDSWRYQVLTASLALVPVFILLVVLVPESPLWLHCKGRLAETQAVLRRLARLNNKDPSLIVLTDEGTVENCRTVTSDGETLIDNKDEPAVSIIDLFKTVPSTMLSLGQMSAWFSVSLVFFGLAFGVGDIGGSEYLNSVLLSSVELPAWFICFAVNYFGRKPTLLVCLMFSSIACFILPFTQPLADGHVQIVFAMIGKLMISGAFQLLYTYTPELYPTVLRGTGLLLCSALNSVAVIVAPFVTELDYGPYDCTPYIIFAASGVLASVFIFFFSLETLNKPLPNTLDDFYKFAEGR